MKLLHTDFTIQWEHQLQPNGRGIWLASQGDRVVMIYQLPPNTFESHFIDGLSEVDETRFPYLDWAIEACEKFLREPLARN